MCQTRTLSLAINESWSFLPLDGLRSSVVAQDLRVPPGHQALAQVDSTTRRSKRLSPTKKARPGTRLTRQKRSFGTTSIGFSMLQAERLVQSVLRVHKDSQEQRRRFPAQRALRVQQDLQVPQALPVQPAQRAQTQLFLARPAQQVPKVQSVSQAPQALLVLRVSREMLEQPVPQAP